ncbi:MAG: discoidin domain-containing protein [Acidobacteria bacterium]|nr:discoidin domain-containing protein [Acidobacteriota bacterium]
MIDRNRLNRLTLPLAALAVCFLLTTIAAADSASLAGDWRFALDRDDRGVRDNWFDQSLADKIRLPGVLQAQGYGDPISTATPWVLSLYDKNWFLREDYRDFTAPGKVKVPFLAQPPRHYLGAAWYQREIEIPAAWTGKRITLFLERPRWESTVWIDGTKVGSNLSLVAPHEYELPVLSAGRHRLSIRVDNRMLMDYRPDAHSVSDSLGQSWNGIAGRIELRATSPVFIDDAQVFATLGRGDAATRRGTATVKIRIGNQTGRSGRGTITANGRDFPVSWDDKGGAAEIRLDFPDAKEWNEFHPNLYKIDLQLKGENEADDWRHLTFGFAEIKAEGSEFRLNGRPIYLRGTHHGGDFPLTGYPPTDVEYWRRILRINKDWGINHIRFHSFCPPEAAFEAADELGVYLQPEPAMWNTVSPGTPMEKMLYDETERMIRAYGNHPSYLMLSPSNEPKGNWKQAFDKWIEHYRQADPRRLYDNGTGHTEREVPDLAKGTDFLVMQRIGQKMLRGSSAWFGRDYGASLEGINVPVASHELGQWVAYPDFDVIKKFTGYLRPGNYEIFRESARRKGVLAMNKQFAYASGRFQLACYKEEIEANLRTPKMYGYQLLDLHDYLGQGTALVGILDAFWEPKSYATAAEFKRFNNETVPLARLYKRTFKTDEKFETDVEIAHFGEKPLENARPYWKIVDRFGKPVKSGDLPARTIPIGKNIALGKIAADLAELPAPNAYKLVVGLRGTTFENDWNFWVYPASVEKSEPRDVVVTHSWDEAEKLLAKGAKVLYMPRKADLDWTSPPLDAVPVFWTRYMNPAWSRMMGLWIDKSHAALGGFPTDAYADWQWIELVKTARAFNLDRLPKNLRPIVQPVDDWNRNYKLGMLFEARVGRGRLMVSSIDLENDLDTRVAARALRRSVLDYMESARFNPPAAVAPENFRAVLFDTRVMKKLGAKAIGAGDSSNALDGDPNTFWLAGDPKKDRQNQELTIGFPNAVSFSGLVLMPRQNHRDHEGDVREYRVLTSDDGTNWTAVKSGALVSTFDPQRIDFGRSVSAKFVKFVALSGFGADRMTSLAELAVVYTGPKLPEDADDLEYKRVRSASTDIDESLPADDRKPKPTPRKKP